ncbi:YbhB/YbcL family Raf kinase inhibitor-like protein [Corynebacterium urealyticum]|nr:YbhB/YbcL family Raf kinase inhibitor-like protein [Corynebacterium urealyticum]
MTLNPEDASTQASYVDERFPGPDPYAPLADLPKLKISSETFADGDRLPEAQLGGNDVSPQLSWEPGPEGTESYAVTCFDPDAPTASGFWHWAVFNIPASVTSLHLDAGDAELAGLPKGATALRGDSGSRGYYGAMPPEGHGPHRYLFAVHAVGEKLDISDSATPTVLGFNLQFKALARGILWGWAEN